MSLEEDGVIMTSSWVQVTAKFAQGTSRYNNVLGIHCFKATNMSDQLAYCSSFLHMYLETKCLEPGIFLDTQPMQDWDSASND